MSNRVLFENKIRVVCESILVDDKFKKKKRIYLAFDVLRSIALTDCDQSMKKKKEKNSGWCFFYCLIEMEIHSSIWLFVCKKKNLVDEFLFIN